MKRIVFVFTLVLLTFAGWTLMNEESGTRTITSQETYTLMQSDTSLLLLDVRTPQEWRGGSGRLAGAILIPVQELENRLHELYPHKEKTIIAYCRSGNRSGTAARILNANGFKALNMVGGMIRWNDEQLPVVRESSP